MLRRSTTTLLPLSLLALSMLLTCAGCGDADADADAANNGTTSANNAATSTNAGTTSTNAGTTSANNSTTPQPVNFDGDIPYDTLSAYNFFTGDLVNLTPNDGVLPYTVAAPLWSDQAEKGRFIALPPGTQVTLTDDDEGWEWPEGAILIKTFYFNLDRSDLENTPYRTVETRLLRREDGAWVSYIYVWNDDETEATLTKLGSRVQIAFTDTDGQPATQTYLVPNTEECKSCHEIDDAQRPLGLSISQMNRTVERDGQTVNQLDWLASNDVFAQPPADLDTMPALVDPFDPTLDLNARARAYLHGNCGHCHRDGGGGGRSGLRLVWFEDRDSRIGICKSPVAAGSGSGGRTADIVPGHPEESILVYRMSSTDPEIKMPELPNLLVDQQGVDLISEWITAMEPAGCP